MKTFLLLLLTIATTYARIGETEEEITTRFDKPEQWMFSCSRETRVKP